MRTKCRSANKTLSMSMLFSALDYRMSKLVLLVNVGSTKCQQDGSAQWARLHSHNKHMITTATKTIS